MRSSPLSIKNNNINAFNNQIGMAKIKSKIREVDKKAVRLLCTSFNESLLSGKDYKAALVKMIESQRQFIPELRTVDSASVLAGNNAQMIILMPPDIRRLVIKLITHLLTKHINPLLDPADIFLMEVFVDKQILELKEWT
jgi:hypothetical protein